MFKAEIVSLKEPFSRKTGRRLGLALKEKLGGEPGAAWLFCSPEKGLDELVRGVAGSVGTPNLVGCTTDGEISPDGIGRGSAILGGILTDDIEFHTALAGEIGRDSARAGREIGRRLPGSVRYIQLFTDGLTGNGCAILRGLSEAVGREIPVAGGTAGDAGRFRKTWQFLGDRVLTDAAVAIGFSGDFSIGTGVRSGWSPIGIAKTATRAEGNVLYELNGQPALEVYERFLGRHARKLPAVGVEYPLALAGDCIDTGDEDYQLLRATMSVNRQDGSISFAGEIPEGAKVWLTCGDKRSVLEAAATAAGMAVEGLGEAKPALVFFYSCMARRIVLGRRTIEEVDLVRRVVGVDVPIMGFYCYGEYCRTRCGRSSLLHNETATVSILGI